MGIVTGSGGRTDGDRARDGCDLSREGQARGEITIIVMSLWSIVDEALFMSWMMMMLLLLRRHDSSWRCRART